MYWNTVNELLKQTLIRIMAAPAFNPFRLAGGTSLSLQFGHRKSVDIDLFTEADYGSIDFTVFDKWFSMNFNVVETNTALIPGLGKSYYIGTDADHLVKADIYYSDQFIRPHINSGGIRLADKDDIIAMKLDIMGRGTGKCGRKKDFWDIHAATDIYRLNTMIGFYLERYPYGHSTKEIKEGLTDFSVAEDDFDPICLKGKHWELIKLDFTNWLKADKITS